MSRLAGYVFFLFENFVMVCWGQDFVLYCVLLLLDLLGFVGFFILVVEVNLTYKVFLILMGLFDSLILLYVLLMAILAWGY